MLKRPFQILLGAMFIFAGSLHLLVPAPYLRIMPPYLPWPHFLVALSGVCEMALGASLFTRFSRWAAWGLIALLIAVFPANLHMALHPGLYADLLSRHPAGRQALLWARLPLQGVLIAWAYRYTADRHPREN